MKPISLKLITEKVEEANEWWTCYLNKETGEFIEIPEDASITGEDYTELEEELEENWKSYEKLPTQFDIHEYSIMKEFTYFLDNEKNSSKLLNALKGRGAFRRFKDTINYLGIENLWYDFLSKKHIEIARQWCEDNEIPYEE